MRYHPWIHKNDRGIADGWAILDEQVTPRLIEEGITPAFCSLDGETELVFPTMGQVYGWLGACEAAGLDLEAPHSHVTLDGPNVMIHKTAREPGTPWVQEGPVTSCLE